MGAQLAPLQGQGSQSRVQKGTSWCCPAALGLDIKVSYPCHEQTGAFP